MNVLKSNNFYSWSKYIFLYDARLQQLNRSYIMEKESQLKRDWRFSRDNIFTDLVENWRPWSFFSPVLRHGAFLDGVFSIFFVQDNLPSCPQILLHTRQKYFEQLTLKISWTINKKFFAMQISSRDRVTPYQRLETAEWIRSNPAGDQTSSLCSPAGQPRCLDSPVWRTGAEQ